MAAEDRQEPSHDLPLLYASWHRALPGPFDLGLDFGYLQPDGEPRPNVRVVMTWEHAKILQEVLEKAIEQREQNAGEIKLPAGITVGGATQPDDDPATTTADKEV